MDITPLLKNVRIVLVAPQHPGNIGATARAMKTMGLSELVLVTPKSFATSSELSANGQAIAMAAGAEDILREAKIYPDLLSAIAESRLIIGTSARSRSVAWPVLEPAAAASELIKHAHTASVAVLFGRERIGLTNEELQLCHYHLYIPANPAYSSLNLASAVQIICYEVRKAALAMCGEGDTGESPSGLASTAELEHYFTHMQAVLTTIGFIKPGHPNRIMKRLRRLYQRAQLESVEVNILRGILTEMTNHIKEGK